MPAIAALSVISVQIYLGSGIRLLPLTMVMGLALIIYALNGLSDRVEDGHNNPHLVAAATRYSTIVLTVAGSTMVGSALLLANQGRLHLGYGLILLAGVLYSFRFVPWFSGGGALRWIRLKDIFLVKNLIIGFTWASAVFLIPLLDSGSESGPSLPSRTPFFFLTMGYALAVAISSVFCDIDDRVGDLAAGVDTLPVRLGSERCIELIWAVSAVWTVVVAVSYLGPGWIDFDHFAVLASLAVGYPLLVVGATRATYLPTSVRRYAIEASDPLFAIGLLLLSN